MRPLRAQTLAALALALALPGPALALDDPPPEAVERARAMDEAAEEGAEAAPVEAGAEPVEEGAEPVEEAAEDAEVIDELNDINEVIEDLDDLDAPEGGPELDEALLAEAAAARWRALVPEGHALSGYLSASFVADYDAETSGLATGMRVRSAGLVWDLDPEGRVSGRVHARSDAEGGFMLPELRLSMELVPGALTLGAGRALLPLGHLNTDRVLDHQRELPDLPAATTLLVGNLRHADGLWLSSGRDLTAALRGEAVVYVVNAPVLLREDIGVAEALPGELAAAGYRGGDLPLGAGARAELLHARGAAAGLSAFTGAASTDGRARMSTFSADLRYLAQPWRLHLEGQLVLRDVATDEGDTLTWLTGGVATAGYAARPWLEAVGQLDLTSLPAGDTRGGLRAGGGLALIPLPEAHPDARVTLAYVHHVDQAGYWRDSRVVAQVAAGF